MRFFIWLLAACAAAGVQSCIDDGFTDSPSAMLSFSTDTVSFGTVFTDLGTPTARLLVFNCGKKGVTVSSIKFADPSTDFSLNVDGVSGREFRDVEIRGGDSIYVFMECFIPEDSGNAPRKVSDRLQFLTNGNLQEVEVEAWGLNVTRLRGVRIENDTRLTAEKPYVVFDSLSVEEGAVLTLEAGTQLLFHDKARLSVRGRIEALGEPGKTVEMRGDRIDDVLPGVAYDIMAGQWEGMRIWPGSYGNILKGVDMRSTSAGLRIDSCGDLSKQKLTLLNSWLHNSQSTVLSSRYSKVDAYGCCFSEAADAVVSLEGGSHKFVQCTVSNQYLFAVVSDANVSLSHLLPDDAAGNDGPLMKADFENCIIYGLGMPVAPADLTGADVFFRNCLVKTDGDNDDNFIECIWDEDPEFFTVRSDYYFNYRLKADSPAFGKGNPDYITPECAVDMEGIDRLTAPPDPGHPALGAYAAYPEEKESEKKKRR